jgi:GTP-binding protein HflX
MAQKKKMIDETLRSGEQSDVPEKAILVCVDTGEYDADASLMELEELACTAGANVTATVTQKRTAFDRATAIGSGKIKEIRDYAEASEADLLIFDHELSASQMRNISDGTGLPVVDRTMLILDIFAQRAHTHEGRLQVELAQQRYRLTRLIGAGKTLSRLGGGIGTRGPGETKLEQDRRHIRRRISTLEAQLCKLEKHRSLLRTRRKKDGVTSVAIVGYTNVGKSTLLNRLTDANILAEDKLFATLDPTARSLRLPSGRRVMLVDTVGLVRRLPHGLIRAFHSTLEEAAGADLLICLCDASSENIADQVSVTRNLMEELGAANTPMLVTLNKCDLIAEGSVPPIYGADVMISARTGAGIDKLLETIESTLP